MATTIFPVGEVVGRVTQLDSLPTITRVADAVVIGTFLTLGLLDIPNWARKPLSEKLGLEKKDYSLEDEYTYVIEQLNQRAESPTLTFNTLVPLAYEAVTDFLETVDGYRTESTKRVKKHGYFGNPLKN